MALVTYTGHAERAKAWRKSFEDDELYFGIGGQTAWTDETDPPLETEDETIDDIICYKRADTVQYVILDEDGDIEYRGHHYTAVDASTLVANHCKWILVTAWLNYDAAPVNVSYRKIGVYTGCTDAAFTTDVVLPSAVTTEPNLEIIVNDVATTRSKNKRERLAMLIEF